MSKLWIFKEKALPNSRNCLHNDYTWPKCFIDGQIPANAPNELLCANALEAWAIIMLGNTPPATFGDVMAAISIRLKCSTTPEGLIEYSKSLKGNNNG